MGLLLKGIKRYYLAYLFISVPCICLAVFLIIPMFFSLFLSFHKWNGFQPWQFVGFDNYIKLFRDPIFLKSFRNTTVFVALGMSLGPALGLITALMLNQKIRAGAFFRTAYFLPVMVSFVVLATVWKILYNVDGLFNFVVVAFGGSKVHWLSDPHIALFSIVLASVWQGFGFEMVLVLAALQGIPRELYEAAMVDGAGAGRRFWHITIPSLRPILLFIYIIGIIGSYQVFDQIYVMTGGGPIYSTLSMVGYLYDRFHWLRLGYASTVAYVLFFILLIFSYLQLKFFGERS